MLEEGDEFDEESFEQSDLDPFFLQSELGLSIATSFSSPTPSLPSQLGLRLCGKFDMAVKGSVRQISENVQLFLRSSTSTDSKCCVPVDASRLGLLGLDGSGKNDVGRFKLLGSYHPGTCRFWLTKTYETKLLSAPLILGPVESFHVEIQMKKEVKKRRQLDKEEAAARQGAAK